MADTPPTLTEAVTRDVQTLLSGPPSTAALERALRHLAKWRSQLIENTLVR
jgi:hypothetical protein